jgi:hypothetical protein
MFKQPVDKEYYEAGNDSRDSMVSAVSRLAFLVRKIRLSPKLRRHMKAVCEEGNVTFLVPIIDVSTRWNSTYDMLTRALEYRFIIKDTVYRQQDNKLIKLILNDDDWKCIQELIAILKPFKEATLKVSKGGNSLGITNVIPLYNFCTDKLETSMAQYDETDDIHIGMLKALEKLIHYYDHLSPIIGIALCLDPTMKKRS